MTVRIRESIRESVRSDGASTSAASASVAVVGPCTSMRRVEASGGESNRMDSNGLTSSSSQRSSSPIG